MVRFSFCLIWSPFTGSFKKKVKLENSSKLYLLKKEFTFTKVFSLMGLVNEAIIFDLEVFPPSVSSTAPNLERIPASTNRSGICPEASHLLEK